MSVLTVCVRGIDVLVNQSDWESTKTLIVGRSAIAITAVPAEMKWSILKQRHTSYVVAYLSRPKSVLLHRLITECPHDMKCDHASGSGLDNRRNNLRVCTVGQNNWNQRPRGKNRFVGVMQARRVRGERFVAFVNGRAGRVHIGTFDTPEEAAAARDQWVKLNRPGFGCLNLKDLADEVPA